MIPYRVCEGGFLRYTYIYIFTCIYTYIYIILSVHGMNIYIYICKYVYIYSQIVHIPYGTEFLNYIVWSRNLVSMETQLCHVFFLETVLWEVLWYFSWKLSLWEDILLKQTCERAYHILLDQMLRKNIDITPQTVRRCSCIATPCNASLVFITQREVRTSHGVPTDFRYFYCLNLVEPCGFCWIKLLLLIRVWDLLLDWTAGILTMKSGIALK